MNNAALAQIAALSHEARVLALDSFIAQGYGVVRALRMAGFTR